MINDPDDDATNSTEGKVMGPTQEDFDKHCKAYIFSITMDKNSRKHLFQCLLYKLPFNERYFGCHKEMISQKY